MLSRMPPKTSIYDELSVILDDHLPYVWEPLTQRYSQLPHQTPRLSECSFANQLTEWSMMAVGHVVALACAIGFQSRLAMTEEADVSGIHIRPPIFHTAVDKLVVPDDFHNRQTLR